MAVFTCAEMIAGCRAGAPAAWRFFIVQYLPVAEALLARHYPELAGRRGETIRQALLEAHANDARFFRDYQGHSEREFLLHWREHVLAVAGHAVPQPAPPDTALDWDVFQNALQGLGVLERQMVWLCVLSTKNDEAPQVLRVSPESFAGALRKAEEGLRGSLDRWSSDLLAQNRHSLLAKARASRTAECLPQTKFLRLLDGQITWRDRAELEHHLTGCWHCVDVLCRLREMIYLAASARPLAEPAAEPYWQALGLSAPRLPFWRRLLPAARRQV